jgi:hypothetical protein
LNNLEYEELLGWFEYFRRRPLGWREDNRAAIMAMSFGGSKLKPSDLFSSLKIIEEEAKATDASLSVGQKFFNRFKNRFTEESPFNE